MDEVDNGVPNEVEEIKKMGGIEDPNASLTGGARKESKDSLERKEFSFLEKLAIWTNNFTTKPLDPMGLKSSFQRSIPGFSNAAEYVRYQSIQSAFEAINSLKENLRMSPSEIWKQLRTNNPELFQAIKSVDEEPEYEPPIIKLGDNKVINEDEITKEPIEEIEKDDGDER